MTSDDVHTGDRANLITCTDRAAVATLASDESVGSMREVREWLATKAVGHKEVSAVEEPSSLVP